MKVKYYLLIFFISSVSACAPILTEDELSNRINKSPILGNPDVKLSMSRKPTEVDLYFRVWTGWNQVDLKDWEYHCKIEEGSLPTKDYNKLTWVRVYTRNIDDETVKNQLKEITSKIGGDAVIDIYRYPTSSEYMYPARVTGYEYKADIIKYKSE